MTQELLENAREFAKDIGYMQGNGPEVRLHLCNLAEPDAEPVAWVVFHRNGTAHIYQQKETADVFGTSVPLVKQELFKNGIS